MLNGNRRLSVWRELYYKNRAKYQHLKYIDAVWLEDLGNDELQAMERELQTQQDRKSSYSWHARAQMIEDGRNSLNLDDAQLMEGFGLKNSVEIDEFIGMIALAREYLESRDKHDRWSLLNKSEWGFRALYQHSKGIQSAGDKEILKQVTFSMIENSDTSTKGSIYSKVRGVKNHLDATKRRIEMEFVSGASEVRDSDPPDAWEALMGAASTDQMREQQIAEQIRKPENREAVLAAVQDEVETQEEFKKEAQDARYLLKSAAQANSALSNLLNNLSTDRTTDGLSDQLDAIDDKIRDIRAWLRDYADD